MFRCDCSGRCDGRAGRWTNVHGCLQAWRDSDPVPPVSCGRVRAGRKRGGAAVFRISKLKAPAAQSPQRLEGSAQASVLARYCVTDEWSGDLANGLFRLGTLGEQLHGLSDGECGLLTLLRCYDTADRISILELLENASSSASSFCFSTHIVTGPGERQPLVCIGESSSFDAHNHGSMAGIFIFPRMPVETSGH